jgi:hypothetical protein
LSTLYVGFDDSTSAMSLKMAAYFADDVEINFLDFVSRKDIRINRVDTPD